MKKRDTFLFLLVGSLLCSTWDSYEVQAGNVKKSYVNIAKEGQQAQASDIPGNYGQIENLMQSTIPNFVQTNGGTAKIYTSAKMTENGKYGKGIEVFGPDKGTNASGQLAAPINGAGDWTLEGWFLTKKRGKHWDAIVSLNTGSVRSAPVITFRSTENLIGINNVGVHPNGVFVDLGTNYLGKWVYTAITKQGNTTTVYAYHNGSWLKSSGTLDWTPTSNSSFQIGRHWGLDDQVMEGYIDEVRIWSIARSEADIKKFATLPLKGNESGLVGYYTFD